MTTPRVIKTAQSLGSTTLDELAELLEAGRHQHSGGGLQSRTETKLAEVDQKVAELQVIRASLIAARDAGCDDLVQCAESDCCPVPFVQIGPRPGSSTRPSSTSSSPPPGSPRPAESANRRHRTRRSRPGRCRFHVWPPRSHHHARRGKGRQTRPPGCLPAAAGGRAPRPLRRECQRLANPAARPSPGRPRTLRPPDERGPGLARAGTRSPGPTQLVILDVRE